MVKAKKMLLVLPILFLTISFLGAQQEPANTLSKISTHKADGRIGILIEYSKNTPYDSFSLMNPNRLVIDFLGINQVDSEPMMEINEMNILSIRSALNRPGVARVVFNFAEKVPLYRIEEKENGLEVLFWEEKTDSNDKEPIGGKKTAMDKNTAKAETAAKKEMVSMPDTVKTPKSAVKTSRSGSGAAASEGVREKKMAIGFSSGYSTLQDEAFKEAYGKGSVFFKGEFSFYFPGNIQNFDIWTGVTYLQKSGQMTITEEDIKLKMTTFSLAIRYLRNYSRFTPFVGAGIDYVVYNEILPEEFQINSVGGSHMGFHMQGGVYYDLLPTLSLKAHIRYLWSKTTENDIKVNLGGIEYGIGLIFRFDL